MTHDYDECDGPQWSEQVVTVGATAATTYQVAQRSFLTITFKFVLKLRLYAIHRTKDKWRM